MAWRRVAGWKAAAQGAGRVKRDWGQARRGSECGRTQDGVRNETLAGQGCERGKVGPFSKQWKQY